MMNDPRILIVRPDRIGDVVLSTPLPREIKRKYPGSFVAVLLREYTKDIYVNNPYVDEILIPEKENSIFGKCNLIRNHKFDFALTLLPTEKLNWLLFIAGVKTRVGVGYKFYQFITNSKSVYRHKYIPPRHETEYCLDEIRKLGIEPQSSDSEIYLTGEETKKADELKKRICPNGEKLIGINSTSGNSAPNMPAEEYRQLIDKLRNLNNLKIAVTDFSPPAELDNIENVLYLNRKNSLRESIINFSMLDLLISASTGPMHIAAGLKVPTLSLFCPLPACTPTLWGPKGNIAEIILPEEDYCQNKCPGDPKICDFSGKGGIDSEKIFELVKKQYASK